MYGPKISMLRLLVVLEQRRAGEADEHGARQQRLHRLVQLARLGAVALVDEDEDVALGAEVLREALLDLLDEGVDVLVAELLAARRTCGSASRSSHSSLALSTRTRSAPLLVR